MARKLTTTAQIKQLMAAHAAYKAIKWRCTGRHRHVQHALSCTYLDQCPDGHTYKVIGEIPMKKYLKDDIERIKSDARTA